MSGSRRVQRSIRVVACRAAGALLPSASSPRVAVDCRRLVAAVGGRLSPAWSRRGSCTPRSSRPAREACARARGAGQVLRRAPWPSRPSTPQFTAAMTCPARRQGPHDHRARRHRPAGRASRRRRRGAGQARGQAGQRRAGPAVGAARRRARRPRPQSLSRRPTSAADLPTIVDLLAWEERATEAIVEDLRKAGLTDSAAADASICAGVSAAGQSTSTLDDSSAHALLVGVRPSGAAPRAACSA